MSEEKKTHKRKLLFRYLFLAGCILVIAAVTVTTVFAVNDWFRPDMTIEKPEDPDDNKPNEPSKPDEPDKPTVTDNTFAMPVASTDVVTVFDFGKDVSLGHYHFHTGLDLAAQAGSDVAACLDGTVESITTDDNYLGTTITITHAGGLKTVYSCVEAKDGLKEGSAVKRGEVIGTVQEPIGVEYKQTAHVHFEVYKNGLLSDPEEFLEITQK